MQAPTPRQQECWGRMWARIEDDRERRANEREGRKRGRDKEDGKDREDGKQSEDEEDGEDKEGGRDKKTEKTQDRGDRKTGGSK